MAIDSTLQSFIEGMPKVELHLHIEGTYDRGITRDKPFANLQEFLDQYYEGMKNLNTEEDFYKLTMAYLEKIHQDKVVHTEIFFDPQEHVMRGDDNDLKNGTEAIDHEKLKKVISGIHRALKDGEERFGISSKLIMSFVRHRSPESGQKILEAVESLGKLDEQNRYIDVIDGFGLDSSEFGRPPSLFADLFKTIKTKYPDKNTMMHAGEEGPAEYVAQALDIGVDRIDHGNHIMDDADLIQRAAEKKIGLTLCPLSNLMLAHTTGRIAPEWTKEHFETANKLTHLKHHPLQQMMDAGLKISIHSDDPAYFGGYITENYLQIAEALNLTRDDIITLAKNAIDTSFMSPEQKAAQHKNLDAYVQAFDKEQSAIDSSFAARVSVPQKRALGG